MSNTATQSDTCQRIMIAAFAHLNQFGSDGVDFSVEVNKHSKVIWVTVYHDVVACHILNGILELPKDEYEMNAIQSLEDNKGVRFIIAPK